MSNACSLPIRDNTEARLAELELREMINSYPNSNLLEEAKQKLREVQEILADSNGRIANQYFHLKNYPAVIDRSKEIESKFPDFSKMDGILFYHAESLRLTENAESAGKLYAELVSDYPMSKYVKGCNTASDGDEPACSATKSRGASAHGSTARQGHVGKNFWCIQESSRRSAGYRCSIRRQEWVVYKRFEAKQELIINF